MAKTNDEIYDLLVGLSAKVDTHIATTNLRLDNLEAAQKLRATRPWSVWLAVLGSLVSLPVALWAASKGAA